MLRKLFKRDREECLEFPHEFTIEPEATVESFDRAFDDFCNESVDECFWGHDHDSFGCDYNDNYDDYDYQYDDRDSW